MKEYVFVSNLMLPLRERNITFEEALEKSNAYSYVVVFPDAMCFFDERGIQTPQMPEFTEYLKVFYDSLKKRTDACVIWLSCLNTFFFDRIISGYVYSNIKREIQTLNTSIADILDESDVFIDLEELLGYKAMAPRFYYHNYYRWRYPYDEEIMNVICEEVERQIRILKGDTPKCLVLDCDGVLWNGTVSEDDPSGVYINNHGIGAVNYAFQRLVRSLYDHGVILALCTKNEPRAIEETFNINVNMPLNMKDFAVISASSAPKSQCMTQIIHRLNISEEHIVFVDDDPAECREVAKTFERIKTICFDPNTIFRELTCFNLPYRIDSVTVKQRHETYRADMERMSIRLPEMSETGYRQMLDVRVDITTAERVDLPRIAELSARANKITNGMRYTASQLIHISEQREYEIFKVGVSDKYGDLGLVGAIILNRGYLNLFVLSCRAAGRGIENDMLKVLIDNHVKDFFFKDTSKNEQIFDWLYERIKGGITTDGRSDS